jgi:hypothetical protein
MSPSVKGTLGFRRDAVERYNSGNYPFPARFIAGDCFTADLTQVCSRFRV